MTYHTKFSLRQKLLAFWLVSTLSLVGVVGGAYYYIYTNTFKAEAAARIHQAFVYLNNELKEQKRELHEKTRKLATRKAVISILSVIDTYQNIEDYQALAFDPEKQKLADELAKFGSAINIHDIIVLDSRSVVSSFYVNGESPDAQRGYLSFRDGKALPFVAKADGDIFTEVPEPARLREHHEHYSLPEQDDAKVFGSHRGLLIVASVPVVRQMANGERSTVGRIHSSIAIADAFIKKISLETGLALSLTIPGETQFGEANLKYISSLTQVPSLQQEADASPAGLVFDTRHNILGARQMSLAGGQEAYFIFAGNKDWVSTSVKAMGQSAIVLLLAVVLVLFPVWAIFFTRTFTRPLENLLAGVQRIGDGKYQELSGFKNNDELSELAWAFNNMQASIKLREKELRESEERFRTFAESSSDWFWEMNADLQFVYHSERFYEISGLPPGSLVGKRRERYVDPDNPDEGKAGWEAHMADQAAHRAFRNYAYSYRGDDDTLSVVQISGTPVFDDDQNFMGYRGTGTDITQRTEIEQRLLKAKRELEEANQALSRFLATMSHELRTPLNAIIGFSDMIKSEIFGPVTQRYIEYAKDIHVSGTHLLSLVNDILDMSKIEAGEYTIYVKELELLKVINEVSRLVSSDIDSAQHNFSIDIPPNIPRVLADERTTKQLLLNLLSNAIKFTPPKGNIVVRASVNDDKAIVSVIDDGVGISSLDIERALKPFVQVERENDRYHEGTGLGLALCKNFAELQGGEFLLESDLGKGTTAKFTVPLGKTTSR